MKQSWSFDQNFVGFGLKKYSFCQQILLEIVIDYLNPFEKIQFLVNC